MAISTNSMKGKRIIEFLRKELGLPENLVGFNLEMRDEEPIMVTKLEYEPEDDKAKKS